MSSFRDWFAPFRSDPRLGVSTFALALVCLGVPLAWDPVTIHFSSFKRLLLFVGTMLLWAAVGSGEEPPDKIDWSSLGLWAWLAITLSWSVDPGRGSVDVSLAALALVLFAGARRLARFDFLVLVLGGLVGFSGAALALWSLVEWFQTGREPLASVGNTNYTAGLLAAELPFVLLFAGRIRASGSSGQEGRFVAFLAHLAALGLVIPAIVVTHSRAALSAAVLAWSLWMARSGGPLAGSRTLRIGVLTAVMAGIAVGVMALGGSGLAGRIYLAKISLGLAWRAPWFGHGVGSYATLFPAAQARYLVEHGDQVGFWTNAWTAHLEPLQLWIDAGVVGLAVALLLAVWVFGGIRMRGAAAMSADGADNRSGTWGRRVRRDVEAASRAGLAALGLTMFSEAVLHQPAHVGLAALWLGLLVGQGDRNGKLREAKDVSAWGRVPWRFLFWVVAGTLVVGAGFCTVRRYRAERLLGRSMQIHEPQIRLAVVRRAERWACDPGAVLLQRGLLLERLGRKSEALSVMHRAVDYRPDAIRYLALGNLLVGMGKIEEAMSAYEKSLWLHPRLAAAYYNLGVVLNAAGQSRRARRMLLRAHSLLPGRYPDPR